MALILALAAGFLITLDDVPTPPGVAEVGEAVQFDTQDGRILAVEAQGTGDLVATTAFYRETMPALGWRIETSEALSFRRGGERLLIDARVEGDGRLVLRYRLATVIDSQAQE